MKFIQCVLKRGSIFFYQMQNKFSTILKVRVILACLVTSNEETMSLQNMFKFHFLWCFILRFYILDHFLWFLSVFFNLIFFFISCYCVRVIPSGGFNRMLFIKFSEELLFKLGYLEKFSMLFNWKCIGNIHSREGRVN